MRTITLLALGPVHLEFKLQDLWVGGYWTRVLDHWHVWICLVPCLPIHICWRVGA